MVCGLMPYSGQCNAGADSREVKENLTVLMAKYLSDPDTPWLPLG